MLPAMAPMDVRPLTHASRLGTTPRKKWGGCSPYFSRGCRSATMLA
jgi:hypothetical protein